MKENEEELPEEIFQELENGLNNQSQKLDWEIFKNKNIRKAFGIKLTPYVRETPKVGRNTECTCGSGKKYKKCCGIN